MKFKLEAVTSLIPYIRLVERERLRVPFKSEEEYYKFFAGDELSRLFDDTDRRQVGHKPDRVAPAGKTPFDG